MKKQLGKNTYNLFNSKVFLAHCISFASYEISYVILGDLSYFNLYIKLLYLQL